jgi:hypothetical protein
VKVPAIFGHAKGKVCTVGYATTNDATTNKCYNEQFLSIKQEATTYTDAITNAEEYYWPT